jgi:hypothetical protein
VLEAFQDDERGRLMCPELAAMKAEYLERHRERSRSGQKGAKAKWGKGRCEMAKPMAMPSREPIATPEKRKAELSRAEASRAESNSKNHVSPSGVVAPLSDEEEAAYIDAFEKQPTGKS